MNKIEIMNREKTRLLVHDVIFSILPALREKGIDESRHLKELGADSVDRVEIIMSLLQQFNLQSPMSAFSDVANVAGLIDLLSEMMEAKNE